MGHWVVNLVQHEINFPSFIALGFDQKHFLAKAEQPIDYQKLFNSKYQNEYPEEVDFPRWCIEYLRHLFTARHGGSKEHLRHAQDALDWGSRLYPKLKLITDEINGWFENGAFKDPRQYPREVNFLLELMRIPKFTGWVLLEPSAPRMPVAVRVEVKNGKPWSWQKVSPCPRIRMGTPEAVKGLFCSYGLGLRSDGGDCPGPERENDKRPPGRL
jgi:hypothetical protein